VKMPFRLVDLGGDVKEVRDADGVTLMRESPEGDDNYVRTDFAEAVFQLADVAWKLYQSLPPQEAPR
jgi:hypothetical protein